MTSTALSTHSPKSHTPSDQGVTGTRETFKSRLGGLLTIVGVSIGLGHVWRFPYMVGKFGGAAFVLFYTLVSIVIGVPALMTEFALGRRTRRGPVGAFELGGFPFGRHVGWFFFFVVTAATGYYSAVIGWVLYYTIGQVAQVARVPFDAAAILPPDHGFVLRSFVLQLVGTGLVLVTCAAVLIKGVRKGIEVVSTILLPAMTVVTILVMVRALTLPGAMAGVRWYLLEFRFADLTANVMAAAIGHAIFALSLGGTFMVVYGSYLHADEPLVRPAWWTVIGDTGSSLIAGLAVIPAVFAFKLEPASGPGLIFDTLPKVFAAMPAGWLFGALFFVSLLGAGYLSDVGALEVLVAGLTDNTRLTRRRAVWVMCAACFVLSIPPSINNAIFVPWDLTFGSGMQTLGSLLAVITVAWCMNRAAALQELFGAGEQPVPMWVFNWIRFGIPVIILGVGVYWLLTQVLRIVSGV
ncbi:MAG TPA: sodium-dependent transporter [Gemmatimonadaceae bacterium]|nr:sodium-dependent transporter [Gemmatimonadaceae bacterium]